MYKTCTWYPITLVRSKIFTYKSWSGKEYWTHRTIIGKLPYDPVCRSVNCSIVLFIPWNIYSFFSTGWAASQASEGKQGVCPSSSIDNNSARHSVRSGYLFARLFLCRHLFSNEYVYPSFLCVAFLFLTRFPIILAQSTVLTCLLWLVCSYASW